MKNIKRRYWARPQPKVINTYAMPLADCDSMAFHAASNGWSEIDIQNTLERRGYKRTGQSFRRVLTLYYRHRAAIYNAE